MRRHAAKNRKGVAVCSGATSNVICMAMCASDTFHCTTAQRTYCVSTFLTPRLVILIEQPQTNLRTKPFEIRDLVEAEHALHPVVSSSLLASPLLGDEEVCPGRGRRARLL
jgi:hypothetical protein